MLEVCIAPLTFFSRLVLVLVSTLELVSLIPTFKFELFGFVMTVLGLLKVAAGPSMLRVADCGVASMLAL